MKNLVVCIICFISVYSGFAQAPLGVKIGANASSIITNNNVSGTPYETNIKGPVVGYYLGLFKTIGLSSKLDLRPELNLSRKGFRSEIPNLSYNNTTTRFYYLNLPVLLGYKFSEKFSLLAGSELGYLLKSSALGEDYNKYKTFKSGKRTDLGMTFGINYNLIQALAVELRYSHGFTKLSRYKSLEDMQNRSIQLGLAFNLLSI